MRFFTYKYSQVYAGLNSVGVHDHAYQPNGFCLMSRQNRLTTPDNFQTT